MKNPFNGFRNRKSNIDDSGSVKSGFSDTAKKIGDFFSAEPQKERVLRHEDFNAAGDVYYASVSAYYKVGQRILAVFLAFFIVFAIVTNFREITFDNFFYLIKDFTSAADKGNNVYETLSYESDSRQNFTLYRGGIVSVSPSKLSIFTATGRRTLNETATFSSPFAVSSNKYILVYDTSGNSFSVYNSFARIYTAELDNPVKLASIAEDGSFAVVTKNSNGQWTVRIYTDKFFHKATIPSNDHIFGLSLDSDQNKLALLTYSEGDGRGKTTLKVYDISKMEDSKGNEVTIEKEIYYDAEFPIKCGFNDKGDLAVITDSHIRILNGSYAEKQKSDDYSGGVITGYSLTEEGVALSVMESSSCRLIAYDSAGKEIYNNAVPYSVTDICVFDNYVYLHIQSGIARINTKNGTKQELASGNGKMLIYNAKTAMVCGESKAEYLVFSN